MSANASRPDTLIVKALREFAAGVTAKFKALAAGQPEDQLRGPIETFLAAVGRALGHSHFVVKGESQLPGRLGRPDYAVIVNRLLAGYIELKEPGKGADPARFRGRDRDQWNRFKALPNLVYTDGNEWGLYRDGERIGKFARLSGDITTSGKTAVKSRDVDALKPLLTDFLSWDPIVPKEARALAKLLAPLCRMMRQEVTDALKDSNSSLVQLAGDWRQLLFPGADDDRFADAYAQTVTFALLLARSEGARTTDDDLHDPIRKLAADHALLSRALQVLTDQNVRDEIAPPLRLLQRVIDRMPIDAMKAGTEDDPWLYFYEFFLAEYDSKLRKDAGAYYTPVEVVRAQVRLIDRLLVDRLNKPMGFSEPDVFTLDPAVGTGTYLLGVIDRAVERVVGDDGEGEGAVAGRATQLAKNLFGFEIMVGPYAVAQLRVSRALTDRGAALPKEGPGVYLTDTLESPHAQPPQAVMGFAMKELADQHQRALKVKDKKPILVCLGNPPYDRHEAADADDPASRARTGGWVRWADDGNANAAILRDFIDPPIKAGYGIHLKWLYNLYVYFWRWALWKVFEHKTAIGPGIVSFISASSYLFNDAFVGMREHLRRLCDEIWIIDLGGEGRGGRKTDNIFAIQTPVAIAIAVCYERPNRENPAAVRYARIEGARKQKLVRLASVSDFADLTWELCADGWQAAFRPMGQGSYFSWPLIRELFPWQHSGLMLKRTWPIAPTAELLELRWRALLSAPDRSAAFRASGDREIDGTYRLKLTAKADSTPIANLPEDARVPPVVRYAYRSFDRQYLIADARLISRPRTELWYVHGDQEKSKQIYVVSQLWQVLGAGPALCAGAHIPDFHFFKGSYGGKDVIPLYRDAAATEPNIAPGLLETLGERHGRDVTPEDFLAYVYGLLAQPAFTAQFEKELETRQLRVPMTDDAELFQRVADLGRNLLWLHTYGERYAGKGRPKGKVPVGRAKCTKPVSQQPDEYPNHFEFNPQSKQLTVGDGVFEPVDPDVFEFEVSGLKVVKSWLGYRMRSGKGKKSSPLDDIRPHRWTAQFTTELLELLWVLEHTLAVNSEQARLLDAIVSGKGV